MTVIIALWIVSSAAFLLWHHRRVRALKERHSLKLVRQLAGTLSWTEVPHQTAQERVRRLEELVREQEKKLALDLAGSRERSAQLTKLKQRVDQLQRSLWGDVKSQTEGWIERVN